MADYISREAVVEKITSLINESGKYTAYESGADDACYIVEHETPADVVSRDCYNRILAENDTMLEMLAKVGKKPGDKMDDVRSAVRDTPHMEEALEAVIAERRRQMSLFGDQTGHSLDRWTGILGEEFGELCEAIGETTAENRRHPERGGRENIFREACHVAAVAVQLMEAMLKGGAANG